MTKKEKMVMPLLPVHKQKARCLPFRRVNSVTTPSMSMPLCLWMCRIARELNLLPISISCHSWYYEEEFSAYLLLQKLCSAVRVETGYVNSVTSATYILG